MKNSKRRRIALSASAAAVVALIGVVALHGHASTAVAATQPPATPSPVNEAPAVPDTVQVSADALNNMNLHLATAELRPGVHTVTATGVVSFDTTRVAQVSAASKGRIEALDVAVGDRVHAGQQLAALDEFDLSDVRGQIASAQAAVADAKAAATTAQAALARAPALVAAGGLAQSELERRRAAAVSAEAMLRSREADLQKWMAMRQRLMPIGAGTMRGPRSGALAQMSPRDSLGALIAPFDGVVTSVGVAVGDMVETSAPVVTLADPSTVWVVANVPEREAASVRPGETATVRFDAYAGRTFSGHVVDVASQADAATGTVAVRCELPNADGALRANMFGTVAIAAPLDHAAVLVPEAALQDVNGQTAVFVPAGKGRFAWRAVRAGETSNGMTEIVSGVASGTPVVADGSYWLKAALLQGAIPDEG